MKKISWGKSYFRSDFRLAAVILFTALSFFPIKAQSTSQNYPTPVSTNEISGKIAARDLGDARLTSYYYVFNGSQGDVFINLKTSNLDGDIDVFTADNLRPLTKIRVFSDIAVNETGRVVYLRKPEKLVLRIEGRTPNDQPATFNLKFAGSFVAANTNDAPDSPQPEIKVENQGVARVNSVGTIIERSPVQKPSDTVAENIPEKNPQITEEAQNDSSEPKNKETSINPARKQPRKRTAKPIKSVDAAAGEEISAEKTAAKKTVRKPVSAKSRKKTDLEKSVETTAEETSEAASPLENIRLLIELKDGSRIERPMTEVVRVGVDKGILTLITKGGAITRYSILDVAKMTIE